MRYIYYYLCEANNIWESMKEIKRGEGGGNIIKLINLHLLYCYSYLFLTFSKSSINLNLNIYLNIKVHGINLELFP
jgi:hypothetical protein